MMHTPGFSHNVRSPQILGQRWHEQATGIDVRGAPLLRAKNTFIDFDLSLASRHGAFPRSASDSEIEYRAWSLAEPYDNDLPLADERSPRSALSASSPSFCGWAGAATPPDLFRSHYGIAPEFPLSPSALDGRSPRSPPRASSPSFCGEWGTPPAPILFRSHDGIVPDFPLSPSAHDGRSPRSPPRASSPSFCGEWGTPPAPVSFRSHDGIIPDFSLSPPAHGVASPSSTSSLSAFVVPAPLGNSPLSVGIAAALAAKKAALGSTVAQLSAAAQMAVDSPTVARTAAPGRNARQSKIPGARQRPSSSLGGNAGSSSSHGADPSGEQKTTIMLRNLPIECTRSMLLELLDSEGFASRYDFAYLPCSFETSVGFGYAFVNLVSETDADLARKHFQGFTSWSVPHAGACETSWSDPFQGLAANVERYRNSPVMHEAVPDLHKPVIFRGGVRQAFPAPTRLLRPPKVVHRSAPGGSAKAPSA